jgi:hypothetical protein
MKNKIKHFIIDLEEVRDGYPYKSAPYELATEIKDSLEELIRLIS